MFSPKLKKILALLLLVSNWGLLFWLQWLNDMLLSANLVIIPLLLVFSGAMAALVVNDQDQVRHKDV